MCKGGSKKVESSETGHSTNSGWTSGSPQAMGYATDAFEAMRNQGPRQIADLNPGMRYAQDEAYNFARTTAPDLGRSGDALGRAGQDVGLNPLDIQRYFNPYSAYVEEGLNKDLGIKAINNRMTNTSVAGGVGGDRLAVADALNREADQSARGRLRASMWDTATGVASDQQGREYATDVGNRNNQYSFANALLGRYGMGQNAATAAGTRQQAYDQSKLDAGYQQNQTLIDAIKSLAPIFGMNSGGEQNMSKSGTQETSTKQDPLSAIVGAAMTFGPMLMGMPPMGAMGGAMGKGGGAGSAAGLSGFMEGSGGGTGWGTNPWSAGGIFGNKSAGGGGAWGNFASGGRVNPWLTKAGGGGFDDRYGESLATPDQYDMEPTFRDKFNPTFDDRFGQSEPTPDQLGTEDALRQRALNPSTGFAPLSRSIMAPKEPMVREPSPYAPASSPISPALTARAPVAPPKEEGYDINLPPEPKFARYSRPERNWSDFLFRAGLATLAARGETDSSGVPKGSLSNLGKGGLTALEGERKDREEGRKDVEAENYNVSQQDSALMRREGLKVNRQNAIDASEDRRLARESNELWRRQQGELNLRKQEEAERHHKAEEARKSFVAQARDEQLRIGKPYSDDVLVSKAQIRADNWRKSKVAEINAGIVKKKDIDLDEGWQKVYNETVNALKQAQQEAISRMRRPVPVGP